MEILSKIVELKKMPSLLSEAFQFPLSLKEEALLRGLEQELGDRVSALMEKALAGDFLIVISDEEKLLIKELNAIRRVIREILEEKGMAVTGNHSDN